MLFVAKVQKICQPEVTKDLNPQEERKEPESFLEKLNTSIMQLSEFVEEI